MSRENISNDMLSQMFAYLNAHPSSQRKNTGYNANHRIHDDIIFGEELNTFIPYDGESHYSVMERDQMAGVKELASKITREIYGEPRFVQFIGGVYNDLVNARVKRGYVGVRGKNRKGLVCAILYIIIYYEENARITIDQLVRAANTINDKTKTKTTHKMVNQYILFVIENISFYRQKNQMSNNNNNTNNNSHNTALRYIYEDVRRLGIVLHYTSHKLAMMRRIVTNLPRSIIEHHLPRTIAAGVVYWYAMNVELPPKYESGENVLRNIKMSRSSIKKIMSKLKNVSINIKIK
jgi:hypothetical protein